MLTSGEWMPPSRLYGPRLFRQVKPARQVEMAQLMVASDNYSNAYAQALLVGTPADQLTGKKPTRLTRGLSPEEVARLEKEMESLETELRATAA